MTAISSINIIYNPNSTGSGKELATRLAADLHKALPGLKVSLIKTKHAGHAETLAYDLARATKRPMIISVSGDGGYHEVINGLLRAQAEGAKPIAGLLPAGNANDHFHNTHEGDLVENIVQGKVRQIDIFKLVATLDGQPFIRYAHSYIGFGLTPKIGRELNKTQLNRLNEIGIVLRGLVKLKPTRLKINGKMRSYDSVIFSNVATMSKVLSVPDHATNDDGTFEVSMFRRRNTLQLFMLLLRASLAGLKGTKASQYTLQTVRPTVVQLDGEIFTLDACTVSITLEPRHLSCII